MYKRQEVEGIGIERDLAGLPVIYGPSDLDIWNPDDEQAQEILNGLQTQVRNIRRDEMEGVVLPDGYKLELLSTGGSRQFDTNAIIRNTSEIGLVKNGVILPLLNDSALLK